MLLLAEYGSHAHGLATHASDHDLMGIYLESDAQVYGLATAKTQQTNLGRRSTSADTDVTLHPLRKYVSLAAGGNPTVLSLLWTPDHLVEKTSPAAQLLIEHRELFVTRRTITAHMGYATSQRKALLGERSQRTSRPELVDEHGFDTKFAMHLLRLLFQGIELAEHRQYTVPMPHEQILVLQSVRRGLLTLENVLAWADQLQHQLRQAEEASTLPEQPDADAVDRLLFDVRVIARSHMTSARGGSTPTYAG